MGRLDELKATPTTGHEADAVARPLNELVRLLVDEVRGIARTRGSIPNKGFSLITGDWAQRWVDELDKAGLPGGGMDIIEAMGCCRNCGRTWHPANCPSCGALG